MKILKSFKKIILVLLLTGLVLIIGGIYFLQKNALLPLEGRLQLKQLKKEVMVWRDPEGIPHIYAQNTQDLFFTYGYIVASERLFQMEIQRRLAKGELAEIFGEKALTSDKLFRTIGLYHHAKIWEKNFYKNNKDSKLLPMATAMKSFFAGVNHFIAEGPLPMEFFLLGIRPTPLTPADAHAFTGFMGYSFGVALQNEPMLSQLYEKLSTEMVEELRNEMTPPLIKKAADGIFRQQKVVQFLFSGSPTYAQSMGQFMEQLEKSFAPFHGSNGWVLAGSRSASGFPILANDPHISHSLPGIWFEAHLSSPDYQNYGHFIPLIPFPILAHNQERGWGLTMSLIDDMDLYREKLDAKNEQYYFRNELLPLEVREEIILVKGAAPLHLKIKSTHHGPLLDQILEQPSLSFAWPYYNLNNRPLEAIYRMGTAKNMQDFKSAVGLGVTPGLNVLYADKTGQIAWWIMGEISKKRKELPRDFILDGFSGADEISELIDFNHPNRPKLENPESGLIVSANAKPFSDRIAGLHNELRGDWQPDDRFKTLQAILNAKPKWSPEELMEVQSLSANFENKALLNKMAAVLIFANDEEKKFYLPYLSLLEKWNFISEKEKGAPLIFYLWSQKILQKVLSSQNMSMDDQKNLARYPNGHLFFKRIIFNQASPWWQKNPHGQVITQCFKETISELREEFGGDIGQWQWGKKHTLEFVHPLGRAWPLNYFFNEGPHPIGGATHEVNNQKSSSLFDFKVSSGPSTRRIIDYFSPEYSWGILPLGNSGHKLSPYFKNQRERYFAGKYRPQLMVDESEFSKNTSSPAYLGSKKLVFFP